MFVLTAGLAAAQVSSSQAAGARPWMANDPWLKANPKATQKASVPALKGGPSAHDPHYDDLELWPEADGKPLYKTQKYENGRLLVWDRMDSDPKVNPWDLDNWLEDGKSATQPPDEETDLLFPAADKPYWVAAGRQARWHWKMVARHVTIERNARVEVDGSEIYGNLWVKDGAQVWLDMGGGVAGGNHTFLRCDIPLGWRPGMPPRPFDVKFAEMPYAAQITHYFNVAKEPSASVETVGAWGGLDRWMIGSGRFIVGPDSYAGCGTRGGVAVTKNATVEIQSGAAFSRLNAINMGYDIHFEGTLRGGSPERPLVRDCCLGLSWKGNEDGSPNGGTGAMFMPGSKIEVYSRDKSKARLRIQWLGTLQWGLINGDPVWEHPPLKPNDREDSRYKAAYAWDRAWREAVAGNKIDRATEVDFLGKMVLDGVLLDNFRKYGIHLADPEDRKQWTNVSYGEHNLAQGDELFSYAASRPVKMTPPAEQFGNDLPIDVAIECSERGLDLRYTLDGSVPDHKSPRYEKPIRVTGPTTINALALKDGIPYGRMAHGVYRSRSK